MKLLLPVVLGITLSAVAQQKAQNPVEAQSNGECSPNIISNQGKVEFTCKVTSIDEATAKKLASLLSAVLRQGGKTGNLMAEINHKVDMLLELARQQSPPIRELTDLQKQGIKEFLKTLPSSVKIAVGSVYGSGDGDIYANQFLALLDDRRYQSQTGALIRTGFPPEFTGVFVATATDSDPALSYRDAFVKKLLDLGISARPSNGTKNVLPGNLDLLVGYRPEEVRRP